MARLFLVSLLATAFVAFATPRIFIDYGDYAHLTHVENAGLLALGEGVDDTGDKRFVLSSRAVIESTVEQCPVIDNFPIHGSVKQRQVSGYDLEIYALNCRLII